MTLRTAFLAIFAGLALPLLSQSPAAGALSAPAVPTPSVSPGSYRIPQNLFFSYSHKHRLELSINGDTFTPYQSPVFLTGAADEEIRYQVRARLFNIEPDSKYIREDSFLWIIDRKPPQPPRYSFENIEGGRLVVCTLSEPGRVEIRTYHPLAKAFSTESVPSGSSFFLPSGARMVAWGIDASGNRSEPSSPDFTLPDSRAKPYKIVSPLPGVWNNAQPLYIEAAAGAEIRYTLDGSDPAVSGVEYSEPVLIDAEGSLLVRISARNSLGRAWDESISYSVEPLPLPDLGSLDFSSPLVELGGFAEVRIPYGFTYSIGDEIPHNAGGKTLSFSAVQGAETVYPLIMKNEEGVFRWLCRAFEGGRSNEASPASENQTTPLVQPFVNSWNFVSFPDKTPVFYSLDGRKWSRYEDPLFFQRERSETLFWYSPALRSGEVQRLDLPPVPAITGAPPSGVSREPVFISLPSGPYQYRLSSGSAFFSSLSQGSVQAPSSQVFEVPQDAEYRFSLLFTVLLDGVVHGEIPVRFDIDRKAPKTPLSGLPSELSWSRSPVRFTPEGTDSVVVSIENGPWRREASSYILEGSEGSPVDYAVTISSVDAAGNRSSPNTFALRVDLNALFVDSTAHAADDSADLPDSRFTDLDSALDAVSPDGLWRVYLAGNHMITRKHAITADLVLYGNGSSIDFSKDGALAIRDGSLSVLQCALSKDERSESSLSPADSRSTGSALIDLISSTFLSRSSTWKLSDRGGNPIIRCTDSRLVFERSGFESVSDEYAQIIDSQGSEIGIDGCELIASGSVASPVSLRASRALIRNSSISVFAETAGRALEAWSSRIDADRLTLRGSNTDAFSQAAAQAAIRDSRFTTGALSLPDKNEGPLPYAVWIDRNSVLSGADAITAGGFRAVVGGPGASR
ncbi:chitobiase/beta-hexosaminidase C-terminal domain-containing protein [Treponema zuelzerae]|uniref:Chitobiase/beta-hexosaminidase C-terminal domain-containing protein n=1 Tax=Teretinema zuelzerae TaxID=156 RepID=A0AAE3EFS5_9SPIR|nr:FN3 associated domain-containing protein [Teretinema zuelzerae]MCD1653310.1 chitobiase/beta-hexosaminidase C-terminal domain-containing protein [Teretinema zuelzerae]